MMAKMIYLALLLVVASSLEAPCQFANPKPPRPAYSFPINDRQLLVSTIWPNMSIIIDKLDGGLSRGVKDTGTNPGIDDYLRFVKEGDVVLNIGVHIGFEGVVLGKAIGPTGKIFFFEPYHISYNILVKNIYLNGLQDISTAYNMAAGNKKMTAYMMIDYGSTGAAGVVTNQTMKDVRTRVSQKVQIKMDLVDNYIPMDVTPTFAYIDVQWVDVECLEGMKKTIERSPDLIIVTEWTAFSKLMPRDQYVEHLKALLLWFEGLKYRFWRLDLPNYNNHPRNCLKKKFLEMSREELLRVTDELYRRRIFIDIVIAPAHVEANLL